MFEVEKHKLFDKIGDVLLDLFYENNAIVAGGIISRIFSRRDTSEADVDVYFRSKKDLAEVLYGIRGTPNIIFDYTDKSVMIKSEDDGVIQLILIDTFETPEDVFKKFDFTCVMGAFDFKTEEFVLHPEFLLHNSQRVLKFNSKTMYPILSALRVYKYKAEGYSISRFEFVKVLMAVMNLKIKTWEEFDAQFGRFYGMDVFDSKSLFDKTQDFELASVIESLDEVDFISLDKPMNAHHKEIGDYNAFVLERTGFKPSCFRFFDKVFSPISVEGASYNFVLVDEHNRHLYQEPHDLDFDKTKVYKYVKKTQDGRYFSYNDSTFEYRVGQVAEVKNPFAYSSGLYFVYATGIVGCQFENNDGAVLIECELMDEKDIKSKASDPSCTVLLHRARMIREVPKEEVIKGSKFHGIVRDNMPF